MSNNACSFGAAKVTIVYRITFSNQFN